MEPPLGRETYQNGRLWPRMRSTTLQTQLKSQLKTHSYRHINTSSKKQMPMPKQKQQITLPNFLKARLTGKESPQRATACEIGGLPCPPTLPCNSMASQWLENKLAWSNVFSPTTGSCLKTSRIFKTSQTPYPGPRFNLHPTVTSVGTVLVCATFEPRDEKNILASVRNNAIALDEFEYLRRSKDALGYLTQSRQWSPEELSDPRAFLTNLLNTPEAYALGKALQTQFKGAPSATSINDWAMTAIAIGIDAKSILDPDNSTNKVAGFDLSSLDLGGKPLREVVKALTEHLANPETPAADFAPVRAYALLARHAPELLVKEVPDSVTYGSPSWISLKAAVARIEAQAPGQALSMNYGKIMQYANISPITAAEKQVEQQASLQAMMYWAINEGILKKNDNNRYTAAQVEHVRGKAKERFIALEKASSAKDTELLTREDMAVKILKEKFGEGIDFKKKCIIPIENWNHLKGPYSVIDLVLSGELSRGIFRSFDTTIPVDTIARSRHEIPDIQEAFKNPSPTITRAKKRHLHRSSTPYIPTSAERP